MTLGRKLQGGFGVMLGLVLLLSAAAFVSLRSLSQDLDRAAKVTARKQYLAGGVNAAASEMASLERASVLASVVGDKAASEAYQTQFREPQNRIQESIAELRRMSSHADGDAVLQRVEEQAGLVRQAQQELLQAMANQQLDAALAIFAQKLQPRLAGISREASSLVDQQNRELTAASEASAANSVRTRNLTVALAGLAIGVAVFIFWMVRQANVGLQQLAGSLSDSAERVATAAG
jgi:CHASE3 domain sensor protein